jgi:hypothetical protein
METIAIEQLEEYASKILMLVFVKCKSLSMSSVMRRHSLARQGPRTSSKKSLVHLLLGHHRQFTATLLFELASIHQAFSVRLS